MSIATIAPSPPPVTADPRWARILARDASADGLFWYSVATTGIYCRPSCPSRRPRAEHVAIHDTLADARAGGARACRRCNPEGSSGREENAAIVERLCRLIDEGETAPPLAVLADAAELSPGHLHRLFKAATGLTPRGYAAARRAERARAALEEGASVTQAIHAAGYGSSSRFYTGAGAKLGMAPARYRRGGVGERLRFAIGASSLGPVLVASSEAGVVAILLGDEAPALEAELAARFPHATIEPGDADYAGIVAQVVALVDAPGQGLDLPLDIRGTAFQQRVWEALGRIPAGSTRSYAEVAAALGTPDATRAVAGACAANALAIAIPCHRVVRADGGLSGYRWGVARKRALLDREAAQATGR